MTPTFQEEEDLSASPKDYAQGGVQGSIALTSLKNLLQVKNLSQASLA